MAEDALVAIFRKTFSAFRYQEFKGPHEYSVNEYGVEALFARIRSALTHPAPAPGPAGFHPNEFSHTAELLRSDNEKIVRATLSNNINIILAALFIAANQFSEFDEAITSLVTPAPGPADAVSEADVDAASRILWGSLDLSNHTVDGVQRAARAALEAAQRARK